MQSKALFEGGDVVKAIRNLMIVGVIVMALVPLANAGMNKGDIVAGPTAQVGLPVGDFGDAADVGFGFGAIGDYMVTNNVAIGADVVYNFFSASTDGFQSEGVDVKIDDFKVLQIGAHAKMYFNPMENTNPFVFAGLALYNSKGGGSASVEIPGVGTFDGSASGSSTDFGVNAGGGAQFKAGEKMRLAAQAHVHMILSDPSSTYIGAALSLLFGIGGN